MTTATATVTPEVQKNETRQNRAVVAPAYRIDNGETVFTIDVSLPGVSQENLEINLENRVLTLTATTEETSYEGYRPLHVEYRTTNYHTSFRLPGGIDTESIGAELEHGILKITLPKDQKNVRRKITINAD